jgi:cytochrome c-type biogenesis protein CcmH
MAVFWSLAACMLLVALLLVLRHLIAVRQVSRDTAESPVLAIFKQRMQELEHDFEAGLISDAQLQTVKLEMEKNLLDEVQNITAAAEQPLRLAPDWKTAGVVLILVPVLAIALYFQVGQPGIIDALRLAGVHGAADGHEQQASIEAMVDGLAARLRDSPDDLEGWTMLARSYKALGRYTDAVAAYEHVYSLAGTDAGVMLQYADVLAMANGNRMAGKPAELVTKALALSPDNPMGLWLAGMAARELGDNHAALNYWERLLPQLQNEPESYQEVMQLIRAAQQDLGIAAADTDQTPAPATATGAGGITVRISLAPDLAAQAGPDDALFVFARAAAGPPMPLAAVRKQVRDLPLQIVLNDALAMMPDLKISNFDNVQVNARISKSGRANESSGDLVAASVAAVPGQDQVVDLVIGSVVP